jgi:hypothetical protein
LLHFEAAGIDGKPIRVPFSGKFNIAFRLNARQAFRSNVGA